MSSSIGATPFGKPLAMLRCAGTATRARYCVIDCRSASEMPGWAPPAAQAAGPAMQARLRYTGEVTAMSSSSASAAWWRKVAFAAFQPKRPRRTAPVSGSYT
ncbi:hypothetical protein D3C72_2027440 [compost metagenome]